MWDGVRKLINIIGKVQKDRIPTLCIFLDTEKAFDRVEWQYTHKVLETYDIGPFLLNWLDLIYQHQKAVLVWNCYKSNNIAIN